MMDVLRFFKHSHNVLLISILYISWFSFKVNSFSDFPNRILQHPNSQSTCALSPIRREETLCANHEKNEINSIPFLPSSPFFSYPTHLQMVQKDQHGKIS